MLKFSNVYFFLILHRYYIDIRNLSAVWVSLRKLEFYCFFLFKGLIYVFFFQN